MICFAVNKRMYNICLQSYSPKSDDLKGDNEQFLVSVVSTSWLARRDFNNNNIMTALSGLTYMMLIIAITVHCIAVLC